MCRLLAVRANRPVDFRFSLLEGPQNFRQLSQHHPDGWGIGWYGPSGPQVHKEPLAALASQRYVQTTAQATSRIFVAHVRFATRGKETSENCHPFLWRRWLFAHNGTLYHHDRLREQLHPQHREAIQGQTDSEVFFHWILQNIAEHASVPEGIAAAVEMLGHYKALNFLLSDGSCLYAYRDALGRESYYSLFWLQRDPSEPGPLVLKSQELRALLDSKQLQQEKAVLVCSERLTDEHWQQIPLGCLLVVGADLQVELISIR